MFTPHVSEGIDYRDRPGTGPVLVLSHGIGSNADSFAGLPPPDPRFPADAGSLLHERPELAIPLEVVRNNFATAGLLDQQVRFVPGWFKDTMPTFEIDRIACSGSTATSTSRRSNRWSTSTTGCRPAAG